MKVCVIQTDNRPNLKYLELTKFVNTKFCESLNYKYEFILFSNSDYETEYHPATKKILIINTLLGISTDDIIIFLDSDAWIQNPSWLNEIVLDHINVYRKVKGNANLMKTIPCKKSKINGVNWDRKRTIVVSGKLGQAKSMKLDFFHKTGKLKGLPTKIHINMIMWAYSRYLIKLKKLLPLLKSLDL